jgi:hypothetical protein
MTNKLWHDDIRKPPDDTWDWARTNAAAIALLLTKSYDVASLDHDMGLEGHDPDDPDADRLVASNRRPEANGEALAKWMAKHPPLLPPLIRIHSYNPAGARRMRDILKPHTQVSIEPFDPRWRDE